MRDTLGYVVLSVVSVLTLNCAVNGRNIQDLASTPEDMEAGVNYMRKYGIFSEEMNVDMVNSLVDPSELENMIRNMQRYMPGVTPTGILDAPTLQAMTQPRCGVPDPSGERDEAIGGRLRRFSHSGGRWEKRTITYRILNTPQEMHIYDVRDAVRRAYDVWQTYIPREFVEVFSGEADIMMKFGEYYHGDQYPFDGVGGILAHAFGPPQGYGDPIEGDVHFDDAETFTIRSFSDINLFLVAAHEIGHSLGLGHSQDTTALMAPFYSGYQPNFQLPYDDILGIQLLYGSRPDRPDRPDETPVTIKPTTTVMKPATELPRVCKMSFDSVAYIRGEIFAFKNDRFWRVSDPGKPLSPPEGYLTASFFNGLPPGIQAVYERYYDHMILFFKGTEYYVYDGVDPLPGYPKPISNLSEELPSNIQAAATWGEYNKVYFFKRGRVYRYDELLKRVDPGYPHRINEVFPGVPNGLDGAFRYNDKNGYFVKGKHYFLFNDVIGKADANNPRPFVADFFGCNPNLYNFNGTNNTDYDYYGMPPNNDDDEHNSGSMLYITLLFHSLLFLVTSMLVSS